MHLVWLALGCDSKAHTLVQGLVVGLGGRLFTVAFTIVIPECLRKISSVF